MTNNQQSRYKWYILTLGVATHMFVVGMSRMCMPVLFEEISRDLGLNLAQLGMIWGTVGLASLFTAFAYGLIADRFGTALTLGLACLLQGMASALRGLAGGFNSLAIYVFLFGLFSAPLALVTHKAASKWFAGRQLGLANGILAMGMGVGITLGSMFSATVLSPLLGGWRNIMFVYGAIAILFGFLWLQTRVKPRLAGAPNSTGTLPFHQALSHVIRIKAVWLLALMQMCFWGCSSGLTGYLPLYLRGSGWTLANADGALAALSAASVVGVIPLSMLSDRIGLRKVVMLPGIIITIIGVGLLSVFGGATVWLLVILVGIFQQQLPAGLITMIMETEGVGTVYAGTALGLCMTFSGLGGFFAPPLGNILAEINPTFAFIFWSCLAVVALFIFYFVKETGWEKRKNLGGRVSNII